jgi:hypothetical protein
VLLQRAAVLALAGFLQRQRASTLVVAGLLLLLPSEAWAWGPSTHVLLASDILAGLPSFPLPLRELLGAYPYEFLYGNLSADITLGKRYVHTSRHCHHWQMGFLLLERAETERLRSFGLGYLCHLAADTVAHNYFLPRRLLTTSSTANVGHAYWEARFDSHLDPENLRTAREVVLRDHADPDRLLEEILTLPIFSFRTNKRIFQRLIHLSNDKRWQGLFVKMVAQSRWDLPEEEVQRYLDVTRHYVADFLTHGRHSKACRLDPIGSENLGLAKKIRRRTIRDSRADSGRLIDLRKHPEEVGAMADIFFPMPAMPDAAPAGLGPTDGRPAGPTLAGAAAGSATSTSPQALEEEFWERFRGELVVAI